MGIKRISSRPGLPAGLPFSLGCDTNGACFNGPHSGHACRPARRRRASRRDAGTLGRVGCGRPVCVPGHGRGLRPEVQVGGERCQRGPPGRRTGVEAQPRQCLQGVAFLGLRRRGAGRSRRTTARAGGRVSSVSTGTSGARTIDAEPGRDGIFESHEPTQV